MNFYKPEMLYDFVLTGICYGYFQKTRSYNSYETWLAYVYKNRILNISFSDTLNHKFLECIVKQKYPYAY